MPCIGLHMGEWKHSVTWPYPGRVILHGESLQKYAVLYTIRIPKDLQQTDDDCGWECVAPVKLALFTSGVSEILTGSVQEYPTHSNFRCQQYFDHVLLLDYLPLNGHSKKASTESKCCKFHFLWRQDARWSLLHVRRPAGLIHVSF